MNRPRIIGTLMGLSLTLIAENVALASSTATDVGKELPLWTVGFFAALLLCIAILPLAAGHWWEQNKNKSIVALALSVVPVAYLLSTYGETAMGALVHTMKDYVAFIALLFSLFVVSGGIYVKGSLSGTPIVNTLIMAFGAVIANLVGTTGASVLLIRPLLRANAPRRRKSHIVVFFIFIVSNCGGVLTPLGDPPLFMGFLNGVPFLWTLQLWPQWLVVNGVLLALFHVWDQVVMNREERDRPGSQLEEVQRHEPLGLRGWHNLLFLAGIVATVYASGYQFGLEDAEQAHYVQVALLFAIAAAAYFTTSQRNRTDNRFTFGPIIEVAVLFAGIFLTMVPALLILNARGSELGIETPAQFFWGTGSLSSFLDNAPTYIAFAAIAAGQNDVSVASQAYLGDFLALGPDAAKLLAAISCGAVFMGANTYIGNGPNFMVKAIAEENGVPMPGFFGYMLYSCCILLPIFAVVTVLFFL
jgi:Na+/H+ antiporter NhaD/arsenite permease-like protein